MIAERIRKRLEDQCSDQNIVAPKREENFESVKWDLFLSDLNKVESDDAKRAILEQPFERLVNVNKDQPNADKSKNKKHRSYLIEDTILQCALRRCPPKEVLDELKRLSPTYRHSKELYDLIDKVPMDDDEWTEIKRILYRLCFSASCDLSETEVKNVFTIRHGWREDTLLMLSARRNPPLKVIDAMLKKCHECIAIVDTALYDWIPVIYAIAYGASHEVIVAMIPDENDCQNLLPLKEFNFLENFDVYNRTPLHWTVFYGASVETVIALRKKTFSEALNKKDDLNKRPFEMAINEGTSMEVVEALLPDGLDFATVEMNIIRSIIHKKVNYDSYLHSSKADVSVIHKNFIDTPISKGPKGGVDEFKDNDVVAWQENEHQAKELQDDEDEFADMKRYDVSSKIIPYLAKQLQKKQHLQDIMVAKSCQTIPIAFLMMDFYSCLLLILSFRSSITYYLTPEFIPTESTPWLIVLASTILYMTFRELCQMYVGGISWFLDLWNLFDVTTIAIVAWCIVKMATNNIDDSFTAITVVAAAMVWFNALAFLRSTFLRFSIFVSGLMTIIQDLVPFLIVSLVLLVGFGEMYNIDSLASGECRNPTNDNGMFFCTFGDSLFSTYALFVGGIEMADLASTTIMKVISIAFGFFVAVILLNVVIAIVSNSWDSVAEEGKEVFWNYRLLFLNDIKNYEEVFSCVDGGDIQCVEGLTGFMDSCLDRICKLLWVRSEYWGNFDSVLDRVISSKYGGLSWQYRYDSKQETNPVKKLFLTTKAALLVIIVGMSACIWFLVGLVTCGILWPKSMRRVIFGNAALVDSTEMENLHNYVVHVADDVKWIRNAKEEEERLLHPFPLIRSRSRVGTIQESATE